MKDAALDLAGVYQAIRLLGGFPKVRRSRRGVWYAKLGGERIEGTVESVVEAIVQRSAK